MQSLFIASKTKVPLTSPHIIEKMDLYNTFRNNSCKKVTIFRAPAGYGKTTIVSHLLSKQSKEIAWVSLDQADNDPIRFWKYTLQAVANALHTNIDQVLSPLLHAQDLSSLEYFVNSFVEEINFSEKDLRIVLDDYHLIDNQIIHQLVTQFIENSHHQAHIYLTTRSSLPLPIAKWRVKQWVQEFEMEHLRFSMQEAKQFFALKNSHLAHPDILPHIMKKTEGWISGLILANLANQSETPQQWQEQAQPFISEFLWQEIITTLPRSTQDFLIRTSFLNELEPDLCEKLTNVEHSRGILEELESKGLFTVRLQSSKPVFRYHHLFQEALQIELKRQYSNREVLEIVEHTAKLLYDNGYTNSAIELVLQYGLYELAVFWISTNLVSIYIAGHTATFLRWLNLLRSNQYRVTYEMLLQGYLTAISMLEFDTANELMQELDFLQETEQWMQKEENLSLAAAFGITKAYALVASGGDIKKVKEILRNELPLLKENTYTRWASVGNLYNSFEVKLLRTSLSSIGKLPEIEELPEIVALFRETNLNTLSVAAFIFGIAAECLYEWNSLEEAQKEMAITLKLAHQYKDPSLFIPMYFLKAKIYAQQCQLNSAQAMLTQLSQEITEKHWHNSIQTMKAYCYILDGDSQNAEFILQKTKTNQPFWQLVYARLLLLKDQPHEALPLIIQVKTKAQYEGQIATIIEATVLEAICHYRLGNKKLALTTLHEALLPASKYYYVRTFLDEKEIIPLLDEYFKLNSLEEMWETVPAHYFDYLKKNYTSTNLTENDILTPREREIYNLLAEGITNREIAQQLYLSEGTVRVYLSNIYSKLGVTSRTKAILLKK